MSGQVSLGIGGAVVGGRIAGENFGGEYLGWTGFPGWTTQAEAVGVDHIRWPGGIIAEDRIEPAGYAYDITQPNLVDNWPLWNGQPRTGLSEMFSYANNNDASLAIIIPTGRYVEQMYVDEVAAIQQIKDDIEIFTDRLFAGHFGAMPAEFTLEVGAEYYSTDAWQTHSSDPTIAAKFGVVFAEIVAALSAAEAQYGLDAYDIAVQSGRFQSNEDTGVVRDGEEADSNIFITEIINAGVSSDVDALIWHRYVYTFDQIAHHLALDGGGNETTLLEHVNYWESSLGQPLDVVASWASPDIDSHGEFPNDPWFDYGPRSGLNTLQMFSHLVASGVDTATIYGIDSPWTGAISTGGTTPSDYTISYNGTVYSMIAESLDGLWALSGFEANQVFVDANNAPIETDHVNVHAFTDATEKTVAFLSAWDLSSPELNVVVDDPGFHPSSYIRIQHLTPDGLLSEAGGTFISPDFSMADRQLTVGGVRDFDTLRVEYLREFPAAETERTVTVNTSTGRSWESLTECDDFHFVSSPNADRLIHGGSGNDTLVGSTADDIIVGGFGDDTIDSGAGSDLLIGEDISASELSLWLDSVAMLEDLI